MNRCGRFVEADILPAVSLTELSFDVTSEESDDNLTAFAGDVAALCTIAAGSGVGTAMLDF